MANTEWWQRGPSAGVPAILQPVAHILLQVRESVGEIVEPLTERDWNARPAGVASAAFHVRHIAGVIDRLFTYARGHALSPEQFAAIQSEGQELLAADVAAVLDALSSRVDAGVAELRTIDVATLDDFRGVGRAQLPSTVIGCLVHGAEHAMRHVGQLSVTARIVRSDAREAEERRGHSHDLTLRHFRYCAVLHRQERPRCDGLLSRPSRVRHHVSRTQRR